MTPAIVAWLLAPLFTTLPEVVLAAVVLGAVAKLIDVREAVHAWRVKRADGLALAITFSATLLLGVEVGIGVGITASVVLSLWRVGVDKRDGVTVMAVEGELLPASGMCLLGAVRDRLVPAFERAHLGRRFSGRVHPDVASAVAAASSSEQEMYGQLQAL